MRGFPTGGRVRAWAVASNHILWKCAAVAWSLRYRRARPIRTVTAALVLLACWAVTSTSWSPISRTTASTACSCLSVTIDPPTTSAERPVPNLTTAGLTQTTGAEMSLSEGS